MLEQTNLLLYFVLAFETETNCSFVKPVSHIISVSSYKTEERSKRERKQRIFKNTIFDETTLVVLVCFNVKIPDLTDLPLVERHKKNGNTVSADVVWE